MAARYWIGGSGNVTDTAHWSTTSGGGGGASVPGSTDDVTLDNLSGSGFLTLNATKIWLSFTATNNTNMSGVSFSSAGLTVNGNVTMPAGWFFSGPGNFTMNPQSADATLTAPSTNLNVDPVALNGSSGSARVLLGADLFTKQSGSLQVTNFVTQGYNIQCGGLNADPATGSVDISNSTITCNSSNPNINIVSVSFHATNFVVTGSTFTIAGAADNQTLAGTGNTFNNVSFKSSITSTITGGNTFNNLSFFAGKTYKLQASTTQTVNGTFTSPGTSGSHVTLKSATPGSAASLCTGISVVTFTDATDINASCSVIVDPGGGDGGGDTGWEFDQGTGWGAFGIFEL